ncbi:PCS3 [Symbiodinium necroappetens]|uniref:PCS3 protein n=1 Tax=Symbiodinium necroappetens TaxID=1628268 RepID=A0A813C5B9_9DINO|nr:PCS3 [Symbiodinium necroappetens]
MASTDGCGQQQAYDVATRDYCREVGANFPPLRFIKVPRSNGRNGTTHIDGSEDLTPWSCGELWVLLLLLLPEHMQVAVSPDIVYQGFAKGLTRAVRGPWALPLEALRCRCVSLCRCSFHCSRISFGCAENLSRQQFYMSSCKVL